MATVAVLTTHEFAVTPKRLSTGINSQGRSRSRYINSLGEAQLGGSLTDYYQIIGEAVGRSLDIYLEALTPVGLSNSISGD